MDNDRAIKQLKLLIKSREALWETFSRKRSWKPSEKAMAKANVATDIEAIEFAIKYLERVDTINKMFVSDAGGNQMYKISHNKISNQWEVSKGKVYITYFDTCDEAHDYIRRCVENDRWHAANR